MTRFLRGIPFLYEQTSEEASKPARFSDHFIIAQSLIMPKDIYDLFAELLKGLCVRFTNSVNAQTFALQIEIVIGHGELHWKWPCGA